MDNCKTLQMTNVIVQENGIIRSKRGDIIGRVSPDITLDSLKDDDCEYLVEPCFCGHKARHKNTPDP